MSHVLMTLTGTLVVSSTRSKVLSSWLLSLPLRRCFDVVMLTSFMFCMRGLEFAIQA